MITVRLFYEAGDVIFNPDDICHYTQTGHLTTIYFKSGRKIFVDTDHFNTLYKNTNNEINQDK